MGFFGCGISWVGISVHNYGHVNFLLSTFITLIFVLYLALFTALCTIVFCKFNQRHFRLLSGFLFSSLWVLCEYLRAHLLTGFPWLLLGFSQINTPFKFYLPFIGVYGVSFLVCLSATLCVYIAHSYAYKRMIYTFFLVGLYLGGLSLQTLPSIHQSDKPISVGVIQANLSMRDKWNEALFEQLLYRYQHETQKLLGTQLIVLPESALPIPADYIHDYLDNLQRSAKTAGSAILFGIPHRMHHQTSPAYFNALMSLGTANGLYLKQHLVPFGEYIPNSLKRMSKLLGIPMANLMPGASQQSPVYVQHHPIASLICYELAHSQILRAQLPKAEWIVTISDNGWFGHSLASYQQLQMAQALSLASARYQVVANNDGLSSVINAQGTLIDSLPAFKAGVLKSTLYPMSGSTLWVRWGDTPVIIAALFFIVLSLVV
ncbi:MAG: apolipoprotein N-acyltransferase [Legionellaceae bacterium]|nr:apolipoprotein N-acyltransferase [Legionellaceae bacterium]